jgi:hypothetical protein
MSSETVIFVFEGKKYTVDKERFRMDEDCVLPNGKIVTFDYFDNKGNPQGMHLSKAFSSHQDTNESPERKAIRLKLTLAEDLE